MRQQVNLYLPEFRPSREWLNATRVLWLVLAAALIMAAVSGYDYWRLTRLQDQQATLQSGLDELARETEELERRVAEAMSNEQLQQELETRQARLQRTRNLLDFLEDTRLGGTEGFSAIMKDLSRASFQGLWLTDVHIAQGGEVVTLQGVARQSAMVPGFIGRLGNGESTLSQRRFNRLVGARESAGGEATADGEWVGYQFELEAR